VSNTTYYDADLERQVDVTIDTPLPVLVKLAAGAASMATSQVTAGASQQLVAARATRRFVRIRNTSSSADVYVSDQTPATALNGFLVPAEESEDVPFVGALYCFSTGAPVIHVQDFYG
jgi:hypothetical protein